MTDEAPTMEDDVLDKAASDTDPGQAADQASGTEPAPEKTPEKAARPDAGKASPIVEVAGLIQVNSEKRLPQFDMGPIKAYYASSEKRRDIGNMVAYVCEPHLVPRHRKTPQYETVINQHLIKLGKCGMAFWPPAGREAYIFVYVDNLGKPLIPAQEKQALGLKEEVVRDKIIRPMVSILQDYRDKDFVHGSIRPSNIFDGGSSTYDRVILGECLTTPSSYNQPVAYETIERGMTDPVARGMGTQIDDIYSLGATVAALVRTHDPIFGLPDEEIIKLKMQNGSFSTLTGRDRFTGTILDFLRGTLNDDPEQRWGIEEIMAWLDGRRLNPKKTGKKYKANRPLTFNDESYFYTSDLAMDLHKNPSEVRKIVENGDLDNWLTRSFEKNKTPQRVVDAVNLTREGGVGKGMEERLVCNLSCALDPNAPIRYIGHSMMGDGVGSALAEAFSFRRGLEIFHDIFMSGMAMNWARYQERTTLDVNGLMSKFDSCRSFLRQDKIGFGLERCLYHINPEVRCMSERFDNYYVSSPETMIMAYEDLCSRKKAPANFLDRHIVAFLMARDSKVIEPFLPEVRAEEPHRVVMGQLKCLATIQRMAQIGPLPHVAGVFRDMFGALYKRFHDAELKERLQKSVEKYVQAGDLAKLSEIFENQDVIQKDFKAFKLAMKEYRELSRELGRLESRLVDSSGFGTETGQEAAAVVSSIIAGIIILCVAFMYLSGGVGG
ncbi:MAG: hypothetical protein LRY36_00255 [Alphaproteobacteria bacterium]|nr:hypothetical protein [Alphaproteobacteria bacterium]